MKEQDPLLYRDKFNELQCCVIVPTYNNDTSLEAVLTDILDFTDNIIVIDDGSTDATPAILENFPQLQIIRFRRNRGKGYALQQAFKKARELGYAYGISMDSDGQHFASDLPTFLEAIEREPGALIVGERNMSDAGAPGKSNFGFKFSNFWFTVSKFESNFNITEANVEETNDLLDINLKGQGEYTIFQQLSTKFGFEIKSLETIYQQDSPGGIVDINRDRNLFTGYLSVIWKPNPDWYIEPGLRYNYFVTERHFQDWAPRFAIKYRLTETINLKASTGVYYQYLNKIPRPFIADIWTTSDVHYDRSRAIHYIIGFQKEIADNISLEIETYYKIYQNLYSLKNYFLEFEPSTYDSRGRPIYTDTFGLFDRGDGYTKGIEFLFRKRFGTINGWIAYSLAQTEYIVDEINQENPFEPRHDRTHVINIVLNMDIKNSLRFLRGEAYKFDRVKWLFGLNFVYSSGQPITLTSSTYFSNSIPDQNFNQLFLYPTAINNFRLPAYSRLDLSLTYQHHYDSWILAPYIQIFNLGNRENVWFIQYDSEETESKIVQTVDTFNMFPLLPTIGVRAIF